MSFKIAVSVCTRTSIVYLAKTCQCLLLSSGERGGGGIIRRRPLLAKGGIVLLGGCHIPTNNLYPTGNFKMKRFPLPLAACSPVAQLYRNEVGSFMCMSTFLVGLWVGGGLGWARMRKRSQKQQQTSSTHTLPSAISRAALLC